MHSQVIELSSDRQILEGLLQRDPRALEAAWDQHHTMVLGVAHQILRSASAADDVRQEVFCALWAHPNRVDLSRGTLRAFLASLTRFRALDAFRSEHAQHRREERVAVSHIRLAEAAESDLVAETVVDADADRWRAGAVRNALAQLPERQRKAIELAYFAGHTYREVGVILSIPEGTAKARLRTGLATLGRSLRATAAAS